MLVFSSSTEVLVLKQKTAPKPSLADHSLKWILGKERKNKRTRDREASVPPREKNLTSKTAALRKKRLAKEENTDITKRPDNHWDNELWIEFTGIFLQH